MPNIRSAKKALRKNRRNHAENQQRREGIRTLLKEYKRAVAGDKEAARNKLALIYQALDKAAKRNIIRQHTAARLKSRLARKLAVRA